MFEKYKDFVACPKLLALCIGTPTASGPKVVQKSHFVSYCNVLNERLPKREFLKSRTSICLACWLAALCTSVRGIRRIRRSSGCTLHTCSRNTTNSELERLHHTYSRNRANPNQDKRTWHTCSRNTTNSEPDGTRIREIGQNGSREAHNSHTCARYTQNSTR